MKRLFLLFAIVATTIFAGCKSDDDDENVNSNATPVEYTIVGFSDSELPEAWQGAEEAGLTVRTDMYITELQKNLKLIMLDMSTILELKIITHI